MERWNGLFGRLHVVKNGALKQVSGSCGVCRKAEDGCPC